MVFIDNVFLSGGGLYRQGFLYLDVVFKAGVTVRLVVTLMKIIGSKRECFYVFMPTTFHIHSWECTIQKHILAGVIQTMKKYIGNRI